LVPLKGLIRHNTDHQQEGVLMLQMGKRFLKDESGATAIEYGLICAGIAVAIITILQGLGASLVELLSKLLNAIG
jgi:pilus assembly protein Flp/PilA